MQIVCQRKKFLPVLREAIVLSTARALSAKYAKVQLEARLGVCALIVNCVDASLLTLFPAQITTDGSVLLPPVELKRFLTRADKDAITITADEKHLVVHTECDKRLCVEREEIGADVEAPDLPQIGYCVVDAQDLRKALSRAILFKPKPSDPHAREQIRLEFGDNKMVVVSADSTCIIRQQILATTPQVGSLGLCRNAANMLRISLMEDDDVVHIGAHEGKTIVYNDRFLLNTWLARETSPRRRNATRDKRVTVCLPTPDASVKNA